jgi:hypothetical protein
VQHRWERRLAPFVVATAFVATLGLGSAAAAKAGGGGGGSAGGGGGKPGSTTTTTAPERPRLATNTTSLPAAQVPVPGCSISFDYSRCPYVYGPVELSGRLTTAAGDPIPGRVLHLGAGYGSCDGTTNAAGVAVCGQWYDFLTVGASTASFDGDDVYAPSSGRWPG